ncbi:DUF3288 family protein [Candidatus Cyanaurora vandensis]|uniref:DUF3288 family protein n=1 Tax=Candidatus Cyanaurora vandensis TaxID=2714958 RepID=UPI00257B37A3|nr:DUF3288 family protein [Candidatus Cyanaurora vandensis]
MTQTHPQYHHDLYTLQTVAAAPVSDQALAELARLYIRYQDFKGAPEIHSLIKQLFKTWSLTPETLFQQTRVIHHQRPVFRGDSLRQDDWA